MKKFKLALYAMLLAIIGFSSAQARPLFTVTSVHIMGQVRFAGKPAAGVAVQARFGSCFANKGKAISARAISDAKGDYRLYLPRVTEGTIYLAAVTGKIGSKAYANYCNPIALSTNDLRNKNQRFNISLQLAKPPSADEVQCIKAKGEWGWLSTKVIGCNFQYSDANKRCTDAKQCKGNMCLVGRRDFIRPNPNIKPIGYCVSATYTKHKAFAELKNGKITGIERY
ncbi:carboxypeptidase regulatory-like domain-containing protein [Thiofilum flexile]|uniref:carboxypeptidase regulatory-like domain-containing protein n=1 Tax=Thiofilum flexile TaxID=125627 RepID=UPI000381C5A1|nr:carboxypeptidase regulatory-like domain-containing protein [Thiofilum flexile]